MESNTTVISANCDYVTTLQDGNQLPFGYEVKHLLEAITTLTGSRAYVVVVGPIRPATIYSYTYAPPADPPVIPSWTPPFAVG